MSEKRLPTDRVKAGKIGRQKLGARMETLACQYLEKQGYSIIQRNFHCRYGEIDIVAWEGPVLAFIEVRYRKKGSLVSPLESVDQNKKRKIGLAVRHYLGRNRVQDSVPVRVDLCCLQEQIPFSRIEEIILEQLSIRLIKGIIEFS